TDRRRQACQFLGAHQRQPVAPRRHPAIARRAESSWQPPERLHERLLPFVLGATPPILALLLYQKLCFGGFFVTSYSFVNPIFLEHRGQVGLFGGADPSAVWNLLFSLDRGLLIFTPVFFFALIEVVRLEAAGDTRFLLTCLAVTVGALGALSTYTFWNAGSSTGARYLVFTIPFWCLLLPRPSLLPRFARWMFYGLAALGTLNMLVIAAVNPMVHPAVVNPLFGRLYLHFLSGEFPPTLETCGRFQDLFSAAEPAELFNLGSSIFGLSGKASIVPLGIVVVLLIWCLWAARSVPAAGGGSPVRGPADAAPHGTGRRIPHASSSGGRALPGMRNSPR
ncbi:MAG: hypothetical protein KA978_16335, partial [Deltaproteobacteria bacterium]|nr:hypothetical protein [Deltaproteobacteria bacterium]